MLNASAETWRFQFVVGCGHSGTTLVATILGAHRQCYVYSEESELFLTATEEAAESVLRFGLRIVQDLGHDYLIEKTPRHVREIDRIRRLFPEAGVVAPVRDPRDVVASMMRRGGDLEGACKRWVYDNQMLLAAYANHPVCVLRYEDLIADPEKLCRALCGYVGMGYDPAMLAFHDHAPQWYDWRMRNRGGDHERRRNEQMHQPLQDFRGVFRSSLDEAQIAEIERRTAPLMAKFGYTPESA